MFFTQECVGVQCDNCGEIYEDANGFTVQYDKFNLHPEEDEWHVDGDIHYCPKCHHIDDEDNLVVDVSRKVNG
jgi:hypothetical protein